MISQGAIDCWDCSIRGLDAASALDYAKSLRIVTDSLHKTTSMENRFFGLFPIVATFYQASDAIFNLFDRVLVLEKGRCIYFGPTKGAKEYFLGLGFLSEERKSIPDFLTGVCNPLERKVASEMEGKVPETSFAFEEVWRKSEAFQTSQKELETYSKDLQDIVNMEPIFLTKFRTIPKNSQKWFVL